MISYRIFAKKDNNLKELPIFIELRYKGEKVRISTGVKVPREYWNDESKVVKKGYRDSSILQMKLSSIQSIVIKEIAKSNMDSIDIITTKVNILNAIGRDSSNCCNNNNSVAEFYKYWATNSFSRHNPTRQNLQHYNTFIDYIGFKKVKFSDVDYKFGLEFIQWLRDIKDYKENTVATHIKDLKAVMNEAYLRQMHSNNSFHNIPKTFKNVENVYLSSEEIKRIYNHKFVGKLEQVRDLFIVGCYTAMRFSDYSTLTMDDIQGNNISKITQKVKIKVVIPCHPIVREILNKYNGSVPKIGINDVNEFIKKICYEVGIRDIVSVLDKRNNIIKKEKWEMISTHTARRSGATNMFLAGIPAISIMMITGHKTEGNFMKYIKITKDENARLLAGNKFFNE